MCICTYNYFMVQVDKKYRQLTGCSCNMIREAARNITQFYDESLREAGIKPTQFTILAALANVGSVPLSKLASALSIERTGLTRNLNVLERNGWVKIEAGENDARQRVISLSQAGYEQLDRAIPYWEKAQQVIHNELEADDMLMLKRALGDIRSAQQL